MNVKVERIVPVMPSYRVTLDISERERQLLAAVFGQMAPANWLTFAQGSKLVCDPTAEEVRELAQHFFETFDEARERSEA